MSTRLTNELRNRIRQAVLEHRFGADEAAIEADKKKLGRLAYDTLYTPQEQEFMRGLPEGMLPTQFYDSFHFAGQWCTLHFGGEALPFHYQHYQCAPKFAADSPVTQLFEDIEARKRKLREAKDAAAAKVNGILSEATTVKKLLEIWSEVEPFLPPANTPVYLPAVPRAEVNALLGLPTKKE